MTPAAAPLLATTPSTSGREEARKAILGGSSMARWLAPTVESRVEKIAVRDIQPRQWLEEAYGPSALRALRASIGTRGIVEPLLLRPLAHGGYQIINGARRFQVAQALGLSTVPAIVRDLAEADALLTAIWAVLDHRELTQAETQQMAQALAEAGVDHEEICSVLGIEETTFNPLELITPLTAAVLADAPRRPRLLGGEVQTAGLPPTAHQAVCNLLRSVDTHALVVGV